MRLTSKGRYAVRAMLDLTAHSNGNPVRLQEISNRQNISLHYLEQLFRKLRNGRVVKSVRGPGGGYVLASNKDDISVKNILDCVGENINPARDIVGVESESSNSVEFQLSRNYFQNLGSIMQEYLETTSLGDLIRKASTIDSASVGPLNQGSSSEDGNQSSAESEGVNSLIRPSMGEINQ